MDGSGAAVVADRQSGSTLLDRAGADGGRALVLDPSAAADAAAGPDGTASLTGGNGAHPAAAGAEPLAGHVRGRGGAARLLAGLIADVWVVDALESLPDSFTGVAVTRAGRVWSPGRESCARRRRSARSVCSRSATVARS